MRMALCANETGPKDAGVSVSSDLNCQLQDMSMSLHD